MIAHTFQDAFSAQWVKENLPNPTHDLILLRRLIPWQAMIVRFSQWRLDSRTTRSQVLHVFIADGI
jgi:hypothetical protein